MSMTMTQKILAAHAGLDEVKPGQLIEAKLDMVLGNDITSPVAINEFEKAGFEEVFDKSKISLVMDHFTPNKDIKAAQQCKQTRTFARKFDIDNFFDVGNVGIEHALLPELGLVAAGDCIIGADSHTCTYGALGAFSTGVGSTDMAAGMATGKAWFKVPSAMKVELKGELQKYVSGKDVILHLIGEIGVDGALYQSLEFAGEGVKSLSMDDRLCISNMAIEAGAKNGIFPVDEITKNYMYGRVNRAYQVFEADEDAVYERTYHHRSFTAQTDGSLPASAGKHEDHRQGGEHQDRPGGHRFLHERQTRGHADGSADPQGQKGRQRCQMYCDPGNAEHLQGMYQAGLSGYFHRCGLCGFHADLRTLSGRLHGHSGRA